ncbi:porin family protein [Pseudoalteromonas sp. MM17-2]|uniref:porin family protein n=1 Tax=Pseudoalteromonas sp. MM17-2 TaxID=2917753 RepID=UPI001EF54C0C|nr:porin family protein [Pseudoalteromonas sp. MM17-2]MCG7543077.1 porin family protein [Pseudoalteromonas sp. MM17-2]
MNKLLCALLGATCLNAHADNRPFEHPMDFYLGSDYQLMDLKTVGTPGQADFSHINLRGGVFIFKQIALEAQLGVYDNDDMVEGTTYELSANRALFVRLLTPRHRGFAFDLGLGYAHTEVDLTNQALNQSISDDGFAYSARIDYAVNPNWHIALDYTSRDLGNEVELDSYGLGVSYHF